MREYEEMRSDLKGTIRRRVEESSSLGRNVPNGVAGVPRGLQRDKISIGQHDWTAQTSVKSLLILQQVVYYCIFIGTYTGNTFFFC